MVNSPRPERLVLKFADELNGTPAAAGWTTLTRKDNGKDEASELAVIDMGLVPELAKQFNLGVVTANQKLTKDLADKAKLTTDLVEKVTALTAEKATLTAEKTTLTSDLATANATIATLTGEKTALTSQVESLTTQLETKTTDLATRTTELSVANATIASLQNKVTELEQYRPFNPRILKGEAFYNRVSEEDRNSLIASDIPELQLVGRTIVKYNLEKWPVILESEDFQRLVRYVQASGIFDQADVDAVMVDAKREEAYEVI